MSFVIAAPEMMTSAVTDLATIGSNLSAAVEVAAAPTTGILVAAEDEVSAAIAELFSGHGQAYQAFSAQVAAFHDRFVQALTASAGSYASAEAANVAAMAGALGAPAQTMLARPLIGGAATGAAGGTGAATAMVELLSQSANITLVMGGSGNPTPLRSYVTAFVSKYVTPSFPGFTVSNAQVLSTPEGLYPQTGVKDLTIDASVSRGVTILDSAIHQQLTAGNNVAVFGLSQSAIISSLEMQRLDPSGTPSSLPISFVLAGDPMNPNGGLWERFAPLSFPSLGLTFYGATPGNDFPTAIYTLEYDGAGDFPRYPIDLLSDLNAIAGIGFLHPQYQGLMHAQIGSAITLPTQGPTETTYYMIPTQNLPLLEPLRMVPLVGKPFADLLQPDLTVLVNLGYGDPAFGYSTAPANVPTPFGLFPPVNPHTVLADLVTGAQQGMGAFASDVSAGGFPSLSGLSLSGPSNVPTSNPWATATIPTGMSSGSSIDGFIENLQAANTHFANAVTSAVATGYGTLLPTADLVSAGLITLPSYDLNLFLAGISQAANGDPVGLINAIGYPIAADTALIPTGFFLEFLVLASAAQSIVGDFTSL
jgi:hypothetical protein